MVNTKSKKLNIEERVNVGMVGDRGEVIMIDC